MKLEDQVCSLELAKKLKELGVKQESIFGWTDIGKGKGKEWHIAPEDQECWDGYSVKTKFSAFTVAELGEMLPRAVVNEDRVYTLHCEKDLHGDNVEWFVIYKCETNDGFFQQQDVTEANARAKMFIYIIENK